MINFLNNWVEQIVLSVIVASIFELILPNGNIKKYIKMVLGMYVIFCMILPFVNNSNLFKLEDINLEDYVETSKETQLSQKSMDTRLQKLYIEQLENDIKKRVQEKGYKLSKCEIDADLDSSSSNAGIHNINLVLTSDKNEISVEKVTIGYGKMENDPISESVVNLKQELAQYYEVSEDVISIAVDK